MKKLVYFAVATLVFAACAVTKPPVEHTIIQYRDSLVFKTDTIGVPIPVETVKEVTPKDTLRMETSIAKAEAYYDKDVKMLRGKLENKPGTIKTEIVYKDRIITRDSIVRVEVPVEVEKIVKKTPWYAKILSAFGILFLIIANVWIAVKLVKYGKIV